MTTNLVPAVFPSVEAKRQVEAHAFDEDPEDRDERKMAHCGVSYQSLKNLL